MVAQGASANGEFIRLAGSAFFLPAAVSVDRHSADRGGLCHPRLLGVPVKIPQPNRKGGFWLALIAIVFAVFIVGTLVYKIWQRLRVPSSPNAAPTTGSLLIARSNQLAELSEQLAEANPGQSVALVQDQIMLVPVFVPFPGATGQVLVLRSTNLVDWSPERIVYEGETYVDTNIEPAVFYRGIDSRGQELPPQTNAGFQWWPAK